MDRCKVYSRNGGYSFGNQETMHSPVGARAYRSHRGNCPIVLCVPIKIQIRLACNSCCLYFYHQLPHAYLHALFYFYMHVGVYKPIIVGSAVLVNIMLIIRLTISNQSCRYCKNHQISTSRHLSNS